MNYFGHAVVAAWHDGSPALALGAMLPDFAAMCGGQLGAPAGEVGTGVALHHTTDRAFHRLASFRDLTYAAGAELMARGLGRGPARGAAHVAVELLLDGWLVEREAGGGALYLAALAELDAGVARPAFVVPGQLAVLSARMLAQGMPHGYRDPVEVARRTGWTLARRPSLALGEADRIALAGYGPALATAVAAAAPELVAELRRALDR